MKRGPLYVLTCYILWGVLPVFWKLLAAVDSLYVLAGRIVWSLVFISAILAVRRGFGAVRAVLGDRRELGPWRVFSCASTGGPISGPSTAAICWTPAWPIT